MGRPYDQNVPEKIDETSRAGCMYSRGSGAEIDQAPGCVATSRTLLVVLSSCKISRTIADIAVDHEVFCVLVRRLTMRPYPVDNRV